MTKAITASTQEHLSIEDIVDDIVVLKDGSAALIIQTTAVNFGLLSEREQDATIFAYAALLNSLSYPVQILIRSKRTDISSYLEQLDESFKKQTNPSLKSQIGKYIDFVKTTVQKGRVLDKKFYLVIPFSFLELGPGKALGTLAKRKKGLAYPKDYLVEQAKINLYPKKDNLLKQLTRLGLTGRVLSQPELVELFFDIYNPQAVGAQKITAEAVSYTGPIVEPAIAEPASDQTQATTPPQPQTPSPSYITPSGRQGITAGSQPQTQSVSREKLLKELQVVIDKAKTGLATKTQGPPPTGSQQDSTQDGGKA